MKECPTPRNALKHIVKLLLKILLLKGSKDEWYGSFASYQILENERPRGLPLRPRRPWFLPTRNHKEKYENVYTHIYRTIHPACTLTRTPLSLFRKTSTTHLLAANVLNFRFEHESKDKSRKKDTNVFNN